MRGKFDLVGHPHVVWSELDPKKLPTIENFIVSPEDDGLKWIEEITASIGDWRADLRSTYIRWALALNGLHVANSHYEARRVENRKFAVQTLRPDAVGIARLVNLAEWDFAFAADAHLKCAPMVCAWGLIDMYAALEACIFAMYRIFLNHNPRLILPQPEFSQLRRLYKQSRVNPVLIPDWERQWQKRLDEWHRKKLYDGLSKVFRAFCSQAKIKAPSIYWRTSPETWAETIQAIATLRHALVHGVQTVPADLAALSNKPHTLTFNFVEGQSLEVALHHLMGVEAFCHQLLTALNLSLIELAGYPLPDSGGTYTQ